LTDPTITHANNFAELLHDDRGPEFDTAIAHGQALNENQIVHIIDTLAFGPNFTPMDRSNRLLSHMIDEAMVNAGFFQLEGVGDNMAQFGVAGVLNHGSGH
jgi:hypothetical protein